MSSRWAIGLASLATAVMIVVTTGLILAAPDAPLDDTWGFRGFAALLAAAFGSVGSLISLKVPGNRIGVLLVAIGLTAAIVGLTVEYAAYGLVVRPGSLPAVRPVAWLVSWVWVVFAGLSTTFLLLLFPDGRLLTTRWRWAAGLAAVAIGLTAGSLAFLPGPIDNAPYVDNPLGLAPDLQPAISAMSSAGFVLLAAACILSAASMVVRFRRSSGVARQQLKWFAAAAVFAGLTLAGPGTLVNYFVAGDPAKATIKGLQVLTIVAFLTIPVATGVAVLRYHLFDIDRLISRSIGWAAVTGVLVAVFVAVVVALQALLADVTQGQTLAVATSTLVAFALFQPLRRRVQAAVDRRFDRARVDAQRTADAFAERVRSEVDLPTLQVALVRTAADAVRPLVSAVWLRGARSR